VRRSVLVDGDAKHLGEFFGPDLPTLLPIGEEERLFHYSPHLGEDFFHLGAFDFRFQDFHPNFSGVCPLCNILLYSSAGYFEVKLFSVGIRANADVPVKIERGVLGQSFRHRNLGQSPLALFRIDAQHGIDRVFPAPLFEHEPDSSQKIEISQLRYFFEGLPFV